jgi:hypothetical protein
LPALLRLTPQAQDVYFRQLFRAATFWARGVGRFPKVVGTKFKLFKNDLNYDGK